jgi:hypothetical protein
MRLTVIIADTWSTTMRLQHENECIPYRRRTVHLDLTPEQCSALDLRIVGRTGIKDVYEEILQCWLEGGEMSRLEVTS